MESYYKSILKEYPLLENEKNITLIMQAQQGDSNAQDLVWKHNLALVLKIASMYSRHHPDIFDDLVQEGIIGLLHAVELYNAQKCTMFSTYAVWWIRQRILRWCKNDTIIHIPEHIWSERESLDTFLVLSLDFVYTGDDDRTLNDYLVSNIYEGDHSLALEEVILQVLSKSSITAIDRTLVEKRYGLAGHQSHTLQQLATEYHVSRERVRQWLVRAFKYIKQYILEHKELLRDTNWDIME
jgi:RNA polymerase sigma factor (sigma-70 family)